jgi:hypothetical protein
MPQNPLQQYFRQPKIYLKLPSQGVYNKPGSIQGDATNMPVYGMTGMDEIILKTPDALLTGESTVKVIESCCPNIKNAWDVSILDVSAIFAAIRIATFGNSMPVSNTCDLCGEENDYDLDLSRIIDHFANFTYNNKVVLKDMIITTQPLTYKQSTEFNLKNFRLQQRVQQTETIEGEEAQQLAINTLFQELSQIQSELYKACIESIEVGNQVVTEQVFIHEFIDNCEKQVFDKIKEHIELNREQWKSPTFPAECASCQHKVNLFLELDQSNFFGKA